jgi:hypothetical protein
VGQGKALHTADWVAPEQVLYLVVTPPPQAKEQAVQFVQLVDSTHAGSSGAGVFDEQLPS